MGLGLTEMVILLIVVLIFFGAGKLPTVMGDLGKGIRSFKQGLQGDADESGSTPEPDRLASATSSAPRHDTRPALLPDPGRTAEDNNKHL